MDAPSPPFFVPFPRPDLIGRDDDVERLHDLLLKSRTAAVTPPLALSGQGGIGKAQLAVRYAHDKAGAYPGGVFWVNAARHAETLAVQLGGYALDMGLARPQAVGDMQELYRQLAGVWCGQVGSRPDALLIADNVEDSDLPARDLPGLRGRKLIGLGCRTLVTSRASDLPGCADFKVDFLPPDQASALLLKEAGRDGAADAAAALGVNRLLGGLPLALRLAGRVLRQNPALDLERFAAVLAENGAIAVLDAQGQALHDYRDAMKVSMQALLAESWSGLPDPRLHNILKALGCLPEATIVRVALLQQLIELPADPLGIGDPWVKALDLLYHRNLMERPDDAHVRLHPLVREYAAAQAKGFAEALVVRAAARLRSAEFLAAQTGETLLTLLRELPMLMELSDERG